MGQGIGLPFFIMRGLRCLNLLGRHDWNALPEINIKMRKYLMCLSMSNNMLVFCNPKGIK